MIFVDIWAFIFSVPYFFSFINSTSLHHSSFLGSCRTGTVDGSCSYTALPLARLGGHRDVREELLESILFQGRSCTKDASISISFLP